MPNILIVGDGLVGKTSIIRRLHNQFYKKLDFNIYPIGYHSSDINVNGTPLKIIDTQGQDEFSKLRINCYKDIDLVVICHSIDGIDNFSNVKNSWYFEIQQFCPYAPIILVLTKSDLIQNITDENIANMKHQIHACEVIKCSSKSNFNINKLFAKISENLKQVGYIKALMLDFKKIYNSEFSKRFVTPKMLSLIDQLITQLNNKNGFDSSVFWDDMSKLFVALVKTNHSGISNPFIDYYMSLFCYANLDTNRKNAMINTLKTIDCHEALTYQFLKDILQLLLNIWSFGNNKIPQTVIRRLVEKNVTDSDAQSQILAAIFDKFKLYIEPTATTPLNRQALLIEAHQRTDNNPLTSVPSTRFESS